MHERSDNTLPSDVAAQPPVQLLSIGHYFQAHGRHPGSRVIPEDHELIELVTGGRGWIAEGDRWTEVGPGTLVWQSPGDRTIGRSDFDDPYRCMTILFYSPNMGSRRRVPRLSGWAELAEVRNFCREMLKAFVGDVVDRETLKICVFGRLLYQVRNYHSQHVSSKVPLHLTRVLDAIETRFSEPLGLETLAEVAGWSVPHLHAMCRNHLDSTPHQLLMRRRMQAAREALASTDVPIKEIASDCGYAGLAAFCRQFKKEVGLSPGDYRLQHAFPVTSSGRPRESLLRRRQRRVE